MRTWFATLNVASTPQYVKPYVKTNKNDLRDAEAIAEAVTRPSMRFVPIKEVEQQDIQALHRVRERLMGARTDLINEMRGLLGEYGIVLPKGAKAFRNTVVEKLEAEQAKLTPLSQELFHKLFDELLKLQTPPIHPFHQWSIKPTGFFG